MNGYFLILFTLNIFFCFSKEQTQKYKESEVSYIESDELIKRLHLFKPPDDSEFEIEENPADEFIASSLDQSLKVLFNSKDDVIKKIPLFNSEIIIKQLEHSIINHQSIDSKNDSQQNTQNFINSVTNNDKKPQKSTYDKFIEWINQSCCNNNDQVTNLEEILYQQ